MDLSTRWQRPSLKQMFANYIRQGLRALIPCLCFFLMILFEKHCALARSVIFSLQDCQRHMLQREEMTATHSLHIVTHFHPSVQNAGCISGHQMVTCHQYWVDSSGRSTRQLCSYLLTHVRCNIIIEDELPPRVGLHKSGWLACTFW